MFIDNNKLDELIEEYKKENLLFNEIMIKYSKYIKGIDHIAFRSLSKDEIKFSSDIICQNELFYFDNYNVEATWYKTNHECKRIFVSYYKGLETDKNFIEETNKILNINFNNKLDLETYEYIKSKNQYLIWQITNKNKINHIALEVYDIKEFVELLKIDGYELNIANNSYYNIGKNGKLIQSSLLANKISFDFLEGENIIPGSFIEFAQRIDMIDGFDNSNANNIVLSTK